MWAQNFLDTGRNSYSEVTPSGAGCRIWGLANGDSVNKKFTLEIDGKDIAAELFRRTNKALTITGYRLDTIRELTSIDQGDRLGRDLGRTAQGGSGRSGRIDRPATASTVTAPATASIRSSRSCVKELRTERTAATYFTRSSVTISAAAGAEQIFEHLQQFPSGIGGRYLREGRLRRRSLEALAKYAKPELPLSDNGGWVNGWAAKAPQSGGSRSNEEPERAWNRNSRRREPDDDPELGDDLDEDDLDDKPPRQDPNLPPLYAHGDADPRPLKILGG